MTDQCSVSMVDSTRSMSFETSTLLTTSTINALHFPGLTISGISDIGSSRPTSFISDNTGMCESMIESYSSVGGQDETILTNHTNILQLDTSITNNNFKIEKKDSITQKKRRSRKSQYDASIDAILSLDKIEPVNLFDELNEADDAWLFEVPKTEHKNDPITDNIFSWVHKEFKTNDIQASKHRLLCKLDDMSHARTIRSLSCHNFVDNQKIDNVKRSLTEQQVNSDTIIKNDNNVLFNRFIDELNDDKHFYNCFNDSFLFQTIIDEHHLIERYSSLNSLDCDIIISYKPVKSGRSKSPLHTKSPLFKENINTRSISPANGNYTNHSTGTTTIRSRDTSREPERVPLDYTDVEVMAKVQLENLRQAERQGPLFKRFDRTGTKPPVAPKSIITRNGVKPNNNRASNMQTNTTTKTNGYNVSTVTQPKSSVTSTTRASVLPPNSANNNRTRPLTNRPTQVYRGSQTSYNNNNNNNNNPKALVTASSSVERNRKKPTNGFGSTFTTKEFTSNENGLLTDVSNKPLIAPVRSQVGPQRRTILPHSSTYSSGERVPSSSSSTNITTSRQTILPRSSSSTLSKERKSGIPTVGKQQKSSTTTVTRPTSSNVNPSSKSSDTTPLMAITTAFMTYRRVNNPVVPKFYGLKLTGAIFGAYLLGKLAYIPECRKMVLERLPNSNLAHSFDSKPYNMISDMAEPPEIVSKSATTNIFGTHNAQKEEDQQDDIIPPSDTTDKNNPRRYVTYDELRQKNRTEHALKFSGTKVRNDTPSTNTPTNIPVQDNRKLAPLPINTNERTSNSITTNPPKRSTTRKNQYGDEVYE
ncbi:unnamed protein product [Rotaria sordida]|uniref:OCIA domain-containing protein 1 n=1 Tax=Rotaria sordida TaxID=392033 RepID=A0A818J4L9_9BILA|nr:unnamed protein product [Rotaria sordida]